MSDSYKKFLSLYPTFSARWNFNPVYRLACFVCLLQDIRAEILTRLLRYHKSGSKNNIVSIMGRNCEKKLRH